MSVLVRAKLPQVGTTIFTTMSALANQYQAINLSQGFPDFDCPPALNDLVAQYMKKGHNQYAPMAGVMALREQIAAKCNRLYGANVHPETDVTITCGATQAIYTAITATIREGDEVIVIEPAYDSYVPAIQLSGGKPKFLQLTGPDYRIPWNNLIKLVNVRTRMIILNNPHNPTGMTLQQSDIDQLIRIVSGRDILILSDEVYEHLVYDDKPHLSMLQYPELAQRSLVCFSFGKTFHATGWKVGYCVAPKYLMQEFRKVHQFVTFSINSPTQYALAAYLKDEQHYNYLPQFFQEKRDYFLSLMAGSRFKFVAAPGSYYQMADYSAISSEKDTDFAIELTRKAGVAAIPPSAFYSTETSQQTLRFCFAKKKETLERAAERLCRV